MHELCYHYLVFLWSDKEMVWNRGKVVLLLSRKRVKATEPGLSIQPVAPRGDSLHTKHGLIHDSTGFHTSNILRLWWQKQRTEILPTQGYTLCNIQSVTSRRLDIGGNCPAQIYDDAHSPPTHRLRIITRLLDSMNRFALRVPSVTLRGIRSLFLGIEDTNTMYQRF